MNKLLGPGFDLDAKNSKDTISAMLRWSVANIFRLEIFFSLEIFLFDKYKSKLSNFKIKTYIYMWFHTFIYNLLWSIIIMVYKVQTYIMCFNFDAFVLFLYAHIFFRLDT